MGLLQRISFARDERFLTSATLGGVLGTCVSVALTAGLLGRFSFDGALAGAAVGVLLGGVRLPVWVRVFASVGAFVLSVIVAPRIPAAWVAVPALACALAAEPRQHWATRVLTFLSVGVGALWAWGVTRALSMPHLHASWLGALATLADGLFLAVGAWAGSVRVSPDAVTPRLEAISGAADAWARVRRAREKFPAFAPLTKLLTQGAERLITAGRALDELRIDEQLETVTRDAVTALTERLAENRRCFRGELPAPAQRGEPVGNSAAVDDRAAVVDVEEAHLPCSAASLFKR